MTDQTRQQPEFDADGASAAPAPSRGQAPAAVTSSAAAAYAAWAKTLWHRGRRVAEVEYSRLLREAFDGGYAAGTDRVLSRTSAASPAPVAAVGASSTPPDIETILVRVLQDVGDLPPWAYSFTERPSDLLEVRAEELEEIVRSALTDVATEART